MLAAALCACLLPQLARGRREQQRGVDLDPVVDAATNTTFVGTLGATAAIATALLVCLRNKRVRPDASTQTPPPARLTNVKSSPGLPCRARVRLCHGELRWGTHALAEMAAPSACHQTYDDLRTCYTHRCAVGGWYQLV